jgi:dUTP pyrophosphatase
MVVREDEIAVRGFDFAEGFEGHPDVKLPVRGSKKSAGYDFCTLVDITIPSGETKVIPTGVTAYMLDDEWLHLKARSGLSVKKGTIAGAGVIDSDYYPNEIGVVIHNFGKKPLEFGKGDKVAQGIFQKYLIADDDEANAERTSGFGSTGR